MPLEIVVTNAGRAALINADNTGTAPVTITHVGLSSIAVVAVQTDTALTGEFKRVDAVSGEVVADDTIHLSVMDFSGDSYTLRSLGLYLADGTLFAIYGQPGAILEKTAGSDAGLSLDVILADISAALLSFGNASFVNPPATTERQGVVELATVAEAQLGIDALRALTPSAAKAAILGWLLAQDGAGSGIDADLLDGQHGSWYADITARLGYTPLNSVAYTADDVLGKLVTVDGAGSGADADLLDGQHGSYYGNIPARLGFTPVQQGTGSGQLPNAIKIGWSGSRLKATVDASDLGSIAFDSHIADVWRSSNDGAGSGLDADLLDGQQGSYYTAIAARLGYTPANRGGDTFTGTVSIGHVGNPTLWLNSVGAVMAKLTAQADGNVVLYRNAGGGDAAIFAVNSQAGPFNVAMPITQNGMPVAVVASQSIGNDGYVVFSNGLKIVWGRMNVVQDTYLTVYYPVAFSTNPSVTFATIDAINTISQQNSLLVDQTPTWFRMYQSGDRNASLPYIAIGY